MGLSVLAWILLGAVGVSWVVLGIEAFTTTYLLRRRYRPEPQRWPSFSILKPLAGFDDDLLGNLESHLAIDYPGDFELILGVHSEQDVAWPLACEFAAAHPSKVRVVVQEGVPGLNPKVNQLITLTRYARHEIIALTDSNVRVKPHYLREHAAYLLGREGVGLTSNGFYGEGEATLGSALDNLTLASFVLPNLATGDVLLRLSQIVSKSIAIKREALEAVGGWEAFKDLLAEDQRLGAALAKAGYKTAVCNTPVVNVQRTSPVAHFWQRHSRWAMIRFRVVAPAVYLEPLVNPTVLGLAFALSAWWLPWAWGVWLAAMLVSMGYTQYVASIGRAPFALKWLLLVPLRDAMLFGAWVHGRFIDTVNWRGNVLTVGAETRLSAPKA